MKTFDLGTVLTVTTGRLLTKPEGERDNGIGRLYALLNHMTNDSAFTHQLGRFSDACKPVLLNLYPELANAEEVVDRVITDGWGVDDLDDLIAGVVAETDCKPAYEIEAGIVAIANESPIGELVDMVGADKVIVASV